MSLFFKVVVACTRSRKIMGKIESTSSMTFCGFDCVPVHTSHVPRNHSMSVPISRLRCVGNSPTSGNYSQYLHR